MTRLPETAESESETKVESRPFFENVEIPGPVSKGATKDYTESLSGTRQILYNGLPNGLESLSAVEPPLDDLERKMQEALMDDILSAEKLNDGITKEVLGIPSFGNESTS